MSITTNEIEVKTAASGSDRNALQRKFLDKLSAARMWKAYIELDVKECYFLASPHRQRQINSQTSPALARMLDYPDLNTDEAFILCEDFTTEIVNAFMPEAEPWVERGKGMDIKPEIWKKVSKQIKEDDESIFSAIKASNLYPEIAKAFIPDLAIGTTALWISRPHPHLPIVCQAIPFRELEIDLGPYGEVDFRAAVRYTRNHYVEELVGEDIWANMDPDMKRFCSMDRPDDRTQVIWAYWRRWEDFSDECWQHVVAIHNTVIHDEEINGEGCCPLIVMRFGATPDWPHGVGPLIKGLPSLRQIDELRSMRIENAALSLKPPITYPDDSFAAVEQGVEEGMAYPIRPGTENAVKAIYTPPPPNVANFMYQEMIHSLRKLFFVDFPEQTGDTPPTLGQWLDEMARAQRRIGTPGMTFWREGPAKIFLRFKHLLELSGAIKPVRVDGRAVATMPRNPAQAAAEQQEVGMAFKAAQFLAPLFPEEWKMYVSGKDTMEALLAKMRVTLIKMRDPEQVKVAIQQMAPLIAARHVGEVPPNAGTPGPGA
jgi:hypothetical protein